MWRNLPARIKRDYDQMKSEHVVVVDPPGPALSAALRDPGQQHVAAWLASVRVNEATVLKTYKRQIMPFQYPRSENAL
jgi:hypothetical protein